MVERATEKSVDRTTQLRRRFNNRYGWLTPHFRRLAQPEPDSIKDPTEYALWRKSKKVREWLEDTDQYRTIAICERLAEPINDRLNRITTEAEKTHRVESPTNARQTRRAIAQINQQLSEAMRERNDDPYGMLEDLRTIREEGGFDTHGVFHKPDNASRAAIDVQIRELTTSDLTEFDHERLRELELRRERYEGFLPENKTK